MAIELDRARYTKLKNQMMGIEEDDSISVTQIIKDNKVGLFLTTTILGYFQSKIGQDVDVKPGSEMIGAIEAAEQVESAKMRILARELKKFASIQKKINQLTQANKNK